MQITASKTGNLVKNATPAVVADATVDITETSQAGAPSVNTTAAIMENGQAQDNSTLSTDNAVAVEPNSSDATIEPAISNATSDATIEPAISNATSDATIEPVISNATSDATIEPVISNATTKPNNSRDNTMLTVNNSFADNESYHGPTKAPLHGFASDVMRSAAVGSEGVSTAGKRELASIFLLMLVPACIFSLMYLLLLCIRHFGDGDVQIINTSSQQPRLAPGEVLSGDPACITHKPLCAELLAPATSTSLHGECIISLPALADVPLDAMIAQRSIFAKSGTPIVQVSLTRMLHAAPEGDVRSGCEAPGYVLERISLSAHKAKNSLGFCEVQVPWSTEKTAPGGPHMLKPCLIYRPNGQLFATLEHNLQGQGAGSMLSRSPLPGTYFVTIAETGTRFCIEGDITKRDLVVKEVDRLASTRIIMSVDRGDALPFENEESTYYRLRIQPRTDAGVIIMALLALDRFYSGSN